MVKPLEKACCLELRTAGYIIGWLGVFEGVLFLLIGLVGLGYPSIYSELIGSSTHKQNFKDVATLFSIIFIVLAFVGFAIYGLVIYGIKENQDAMLISYLILSGISAILSFYECCLSRLTWLQERTTFFTSFSQYFLAIFTFRVMYSLYTTIKMDILNGRV